MPRALSRAGEGRLAIEAVNASPATGWTPILSGPNRDRAIEAALSIARRAADHGWESEGASLAGGRAGAALLDAYLAWAELDEQAFDRAVAGIEASLEAAYAAPLASLYSGLAGVGWTLDHLSGTFVDVDEDDPCEMIDEALEGLLHQSPWEDTYDLIDGSVGFGVYALERLPRPAATRVLRQIVKLLDRSAERVPDGITWFTPPQLLWLPETRAEFPNGYYNVGVAHGILWAPRSWPGHGPPVSRPNARTSS